MRLTLWTDRSAVTVIADLQSICAAYDPGDEMSVTRPRMIRTSR
jgi:hypothetical protein